MVEVEGGEGEVEGEGEEGIHLLIHKVANLDKETGEEGAEIEDLLVHKQLSPIR